jgi:hypothetical protein
MTVAAGIVIGTATPQASGAQGLTGAKAAVPGQASANASSQGGAESFRSKWQAMLQALSGQADQTSQTDPSSGMSSANDSASSSATPGTVRTAQNAAGTLKTTQTATSARPVKQGDMRASVVAQSIAGTAYNEPQPIAAQGAKSNTVEPSTASDRKVAKREKIESAAASVPATDSTLQGIISQAVTAPTPVATQTQFTSQALLGGGATEPNAPESMRDGLSSASAVSSDTMKEKAAAGIQLGAATRLTEGRTSHVVLGDNAAAHASGLGADGIDRDATAVVAAEREAADAQPVDVVSLQSLRGAGNLNEASAAGGVKDAPGAVQSMNGAGLSSSTANAVAVASASAGPNTANDPKASAAASGGISRNRHGADAVQDRTAGRVERSANGNVHVDLVSVRQADTVAQAGANSALVRDEAGAATAGNAQTSATHTRSLDAAGLGKPDTFAALDAEIASPTTTWTHAGSHRAEAGYLDPALGWVGVRAEASGGGVHAAVVPGSTEAAQTLGGQLSGLNSYLAEHHGQSATVTLAAPESGHGGPGSGQGQGQGMNYGSNQQESADRRDNYAAEPARSQTATGSSSQASSRSDAAAQIDGMILRTGSNQGAHISVVA